MLGFIKKHFLIFLFAAIGLVIGFVFHFSNETTKMYYVIYQYPKELQMPSSVTTDSLFYKNSILVRNITSSYADTLPEVKRSELKVYTHATLSQEDIQNLISDLTNSNASLNSYRKDKEGRSILPVISFLILGIFIGSILYLWNDRKPFQEQKQ
ncbi:MAG: hypothetical protein COA33_012870 [Fluviicola sp.]|nr:hypothetical protein [Fluviicola sp.]